MHDNINRTQEKKKLCKSVQSKLNQIMMNKIGHFCMKNAPCVKRTRGETRETERNILEGASISFPFILTIIYAVRDY